MAEKFKVTIIGAASPAWGLTLIRDFIVTLSNQFADSYDCVLTLEDIDAKGLKKQELLALKVAEITGNKVKIEITTNQRKSIEGARYVVTSFAQGSLESMKYDLEIPQEYGIYMPVGDTASIGGAMRAAKNIPLILSIARDMEKYAEKGAWLLNLCNPMSMLCRAVTRETSIRTIGCCHSLYEGIDVLADWLRFPKNEWRDYLEFDVMGINHCAWMQNLKINGEDGFAKLRKFLRERGMTTTSKKLYDSDYPELRRFNVAINLFLKHGVLYFAGDRHVSEFFSEYVNENTNRGADYGVLLTSIQERLVMTRGGSRAKNKEIFEGKAEIDLNISREAVSKIVASLESGKEFYDVCSLPYHGKEFPGLPDGAVIERMATFSKDNVTAKAVKKMPKEPYKHLLLYADIFEDMVEACIEGDRKLLIKSLEKDLLLKNMKKEKIKELVVRLLEVHRKSVHPGFFK